MDASTILESCAVLSSGTIATLTGHRDYATIDRIQGELVTFVASQPGLGRLQGWESWRDAWEAFAEFKHGRFQ
jgi:hypothetical protein